MLEELKTATGDGRFECLRKKNTVVKTMINHPIVDGLYHPFIVICGLFIIVLTTLV